MIFHGRSRSLFHASQQSATMSSQDCKMRFDSQLSCMNCKTFSTGFSLFAVDCKNRHFHQMTFCF